MFRRIIGVACGFAIGCSGGPTGPSPQAASCNPTAASARQALPFFLTPFAGDFPNGNHFDHDKPGVFEDTNGYVLTMCGERDKNQTDGHDGYDWRMPEGTSIRAVADGLVMFAGVQAPANCPPLGRGWLGDVRRRPGNFTVIDPYGWHATSADPWEVDPRGTSSVWLWRDGEAPRLR
jgi:murein DD-endopeptidase MepM/ murein hydrolase activator NlpD